ncbi:MAG TPA: serine/threonine-protein kinase [Ktedonobacteraceae bacterium]|nr:serine/threonine-protein kinase [Ktedonobacteraceae bacterium]
MEQQLLGKYELLVSLGRGGMGEVWKARDTQLRRYVAIKLLNADLQANPDFVAHFMREARLVASLHHPNIVQIHDFQFMGAQTASVNAYMVMDYIEGGTLSDYMRNTVRKGFFPTAEAIVDLFAAISLALDYAHQKGMVHRDIKPANILLDKPVSAGNSIGVPILTDFGIARLQGSGTSTLTHALIGTPLYISPEQAADQKVDARSDLYSLGIVLYEMLTGRPPFRADSAIAIMMQQMYGNPTDPARINPRISPALSAVVLQSIAKDPEARFPTATAMAVALAQALDVPVPLNLSNQVALGEAPEHNPLQPATPFFGIDPDIPFFSSSDESYTPAVAGPAGSLGVYQSQQSFTPVPAIYPGEAREPRLSGRGRRWVFIALMACGLLILLGVGVFVYPLLFSPTGVPKVTSSAVGQIAFSSSPSATNDQVRIDLTHVASPPANTTYYGWLVNPNNDTSSPSHWPLQVQNGAIHYLYSSPQHSDLLSQNEWFVITAEPVNSTPIIPFADPTRHIYYALFVHTPSSSHTFDVKQCVLGGVTSSAAPCNR